MEDHQAHKLRALPKSKMDLKFYESYIIIPWLFVRLYVFIETDLQKGK